ncbi:OHCU decarboxylase [Synechococcus sp. PCC 7502]|uniref:2-oxo-4-hydroxy-4-carboxy-5-ureidoimidazoline decarboxylase n=1 Tax=Synechococcus sp. PCC 7502 TaxID=1173263 RepID=UPI00029FECEC|nr:2-oxo-4-hydroxy-4-carboxy-5-ureidoimidazoline decarboxylase [Synechococcus sp. PCC 7502]AFY74565.1 OHCU decarboxylase [Synechococcus sp. PCC 7502]
MYIIQQLNQMDRLAFTLALGTVFEDTPEIVNQTWDKLPVLTVEQLYKNLLDTVDAMSFDRKHKLICAHPSLGDRIKMAEASVREQSSIGLDSLSSEEYNLFQSLNHAYRQRFGFPFIIAVRNHTKTSILEAFKTRLQNSLDLELNRAIAEIKEIARFRLYDLVIS